MSKKLVWLVMVALTSLTVWSASSSPAERSSLEAQEAAVGAHAESAGAFLSEVDQRSLAAAAFELSQSLPRADLAKRILAFTEAFNLSAEASVPEAVSVPVTSLATLKPAPESIFLDAGYQANFEAVVSDPSRVLGGTETSEHPECVAVGGPAGWCCTGTLVAPDRVVTAGHCFEKCATRVFIGQSITQPGEIIPVREAVQHPGYKSQGHNDLTVLHLERAATDVAPARLATPEAIAGARFVRVVGYGTTNAYGTVGYGIRRMVDVPIATTDCRPEDVGKKFGCDAGLEFVAGAPFLDRDSCSGDSGGPAYVQVGSRWLLAGATSRATRNSLRPCGDGGVYVRLSEYSDWLLP